jgi:predicted TIM-barrel fold metal-dependent hydrolase
MPAHAQTEARKLRARLHHPVIDADGHWIEYGPVMREEFRRIGGQAAVEAFELTSQRVPNALRMSVAERRRRRVGQEAFWGSPCQNVLDRATAMLPRLLHERLDDLGIDFCVVYPTAGLSYHRMPDTRLRRAICRAYNVFTAEQFHGLEDRVIPAAIIPMYTPEEALEELDFTVKQLGYKVAMVGGLMRRPVPALAEEHPEASKLVEWYDVVGIDSDHDYDPVWRRCAELGVSPTFHSSSHGFGFQSSSSRFMYNHIGKFSAPGEASAKSLFFGGVPHRFPSLRFAWLEGGASWGAQLLVALVDRWTKRGGSNIDVLDPRHVDVDEYLQLLLEHGADALTGPNGERHEPRRQLDDTKPAILDEFHACGIDSPADIVAQLDRYFFGCEADDRTTAWAFDRRVNPGGVAVRAMLGTDIGHWDVADADDVLPEAFELLDDGLLDADDFRAFVCDNAVLLHASANPAFFDGTPVADYARRLLEERAVAAG